MKLLLLSAFLIPATGIAGGVASRDACERIGQELNAITDNLKISCRHDGECTYVFRGMGTRAHPKVEVNPGVPAGEHSRLLELQEKLGQACLGVKDARYPPSTLFPAICSNHQCVKDSGVDEVPAKGRNDVRRVGIIRISCWLAGGSILRMNLYDGKQSCDSQSLDRISLGFPIRNSIKVGATIPINGFSDQCRGQKGCDPVRGRVVFDEFREGDSVSGKYYLRLPDGPESGVFDEVVWCPRQTGCK